MAFRRFSSFRRRSPRRFSSPRRGFATRAPQRSKGLEQANFFIEEVDTLTNASATELVVYSHLISIPISLQNVTAATSEQRLGDVLAAMQRHIVLNGIVMDWGVEAWGFDGGSQLQGQGDFFSCVQLITDRIDPDASNQPVPASLNSYSPFRNQFPAATLSTTAPNATSSQFVNPTRIHWSKSDRHDTTASVVLDTVEGELYVPRGQPVSIRRPTVNRRLRIRLDDEHGFFLSWAYRTSALFANDESQARQVRRWARGTLYYRFVQ